MDNPLSCIVVCASLRVLFSIILTSNFKHFIALRRYYHSVSFPSPNLFPTENNNRSFLGLQRSCTRTESVHLASSFFCILLAQWADDPMRWDNLLVPPRHLLGKKEGTSFCYSASSRSVCSHQTDSYIIAIILFFFFFLLSRPKDLIYGFIPVAMVKNTRTGKKRGSDQFLFFPSHPRVLLLGARV